ncbi:MAG: SGNH/GDSL hydrolase family protein [Phycisphaerales bacterium]
MSDAHETNPASPAEAATSADAAAPVDAEARLHVAAPVAEPDVVDIADEPIPLGSPLAGIGPFLRTARRTVPAFVARQRWSLAALAVLPVAMELGARAIAPDYGGRIYSDRLTGGQPIAMNQQIHRGPEVPLARAAGVPRWVALGDSVAYGTGVAPEDTWARQLERRLAGPDAANPRERVEVIAGGIPGLRLAEIALAIEERWVPFDPDGIVLGLSPNMVALAWIRQDETAELAIPPSVNPRPAAGGAAGLKRRVKHSIQEFCLPGVLTINGERAMHAIGLLHHRISPDAPYGPLLAHGWQQADLPPERTAEAWAAFERELQLVRDAASRANIPLRIVATPSRFTLSDERRDNLRFVPRERLTVDFTTRAAEACTRLGIPMVDGTDALRAARSADTSAPLYLIEDLTHFDPAGHAAIAEAIHGTGWFSGPAGAPSG